MKLLVVDDDEESRRYLCRALSKCGYTPIQCDNGEDALNILMGVDPPEIVFLDWMMSKLTGPEVCERFRNHVTRKQCYIFLLTARDEKEDILTGLRSGADDYVIKPIKFDELGSRLNIALKHLNLQKEIKEKEERANSFSTRLVGLINHLNYAILVEDEYRKVSFVNESFCKLFELSLSPGSLVGSDCNHIIENALYLVSDPDKFTEKIKIAVENKRVITREELRFKSGCFLERDYIPTFFESGAVGHLWIYRDVTEKKRYEEALKFAKESAETTAHLKSSFLATMSHEIRTPMNGIIGMCKLLLNSEHTPEQAQKLKVILNCGYSLLDLINDILDLSKLEANKIELEGKPFEIENTVEEVVELLRVKALEKKLSLDYKKNKGIPAWVSGDVMRFKQVLINLIGNALKFTEKGGVEITSTAEKLEREKWKLQFSVRDTGIGISSAVTSKLFQSFSQADASTTKRFGGTGLGLAICKGLCEKMGGTIWVESDLGVGSTFTFTFIAETSFSSENVLQANPRATQFDATMGKKHPLTILIAEDNHTNQQVIQGFLERLGYQADIVGNGKEVLKQVENYTYDLILMDCHMPEMDGFEATRQIREKYVGSSQPRIIALSASTTKEDIDHCFKCGMNDFIGKPIAITSLIKSLNECNRIEPSRSKTSEINLLTKGITPVSFNRDAFMANFHGMEDIARNVIVSFLKTLPDMILAIESAIKEEKPSDLEIAAHTLKGAVSNFYAEPSRQLAWQLEQIGNRKSVVGSEEIFSQLKSEIVILQNILLETLDERKSA